MYLEVGLMRAGFMETALVIYFLCGKRGVDWVWHLQRRFETIRVGWRELDGSNTLFDGLDVASLSMSCIV